MVRDNSISTQKDKTKNIKDLFGTLAEQVRMAERQPDPELERWIEKRSAGQLPEHGADGADVSKKIPVAAEEALSAGKSGYQKK